MDDGQLSLFDIPDPECPILEEPDDSSGQAQNDSDIHFHAFYLKQGECKHTIFQSLYRINDSLTL